MKYALTERPHRNGMVLLQSGQTIRISHQHHRPTRGDHLAVVVLFGGLFAALLIFAFIRIGIPLIRHATGT